MGHYVPFFFSSPYKKLYREMKRDLTSHVKISEINSIL
ncbi:hypothetical protein bcere0024_038000 [Bacillus cereus Rock4-18]|nr:hypothetical protein bcere0024_038000 [Bacillus cereus Rock4-18]